LRLRADQGLSTPIDDLKNLCYVYQQ